MSAARLAAAVLGALLVVTAGALAPSAVAAQRPNVIVVVTDDQDLASMRAMPRTRRLLGEQGATFDRFLVTYPLCCPSRATLLTGQYPHNHGVLYNRGPTGGARRFDHRTTLATWLRAGGYRMMLAGKYLNGYGGAGPITGDPADARASAPTDVPRGWDDWYAGVEATRDEYLGFVVNENGRLRRYARSAADHHIDCAPPASSRTPTCCSRRTTAGTPASTASRRASTGRTSRPSGSRCSSAARASPAAPGSARSP